MFRHLNGKLANIIVGIVFIGCLIYYLYGFSQQIAGAKAICSKYPIGVGDEGLSEFANNYPVGFNGSFESPNLEGTSYLFCVRYSMCEMACSIRSIDGVVVESSYSNGRT